jgi:hypothetical protein
MLRRMWLPALALFGVVLVTTPSPAKAETHFGVYLGAPAPVYVYPLPHTRRIRIAVITALRTTLPRIMPTRVTGSASASAGMTGIDTITTTMTVTKFVAAGTSASSIAIAGKLSLP